MSSDETTRRLEMWRQRRKAGYLSGTVTTRPKSATPLTAALQAARAWEPAVLRQGSQEFSRVLREFVGAAVVVALVGLAFERSETRVQVLVEDRRAKQHLADLRARNEGAGPLFKVKDDPRVTAVGRLLRRYSRDELPRLFNVLGGLMSLVGPRPPLPREVAGYERGAQRRLLVKPGITGLWRVNGRSDLSWEQTVRLDLRYVENSMLALDALILVKTVRAVLWGSEAY